MNARYAKKNESNWMELDEILSFWTEVHAEYPEAGKTFSPRIEWAKRTSWEAGHFNVYLYEGDEFRLGTMMYCPKCDKFFVSLDEGDETWTECCDEEYER
jgi:hypothetical protein